MGLPLRLHCNEPVEVVPSTIESPEQMEIFPDGVITGDWELLTLIYPVLVFENVPQAFVIFNSTSKLPEEL